MEPNAARFPFPLPPCTVGEQKAKVNSFLNGVNGSVKNSRFPERVRFILGLGLAALVTFSTAVAQTRTPLSVTHQTPSRYGPSDTSCTRIELLLEFHPSL
jgi:hypothetical protein